MNTEICRLLELEKKSEKWIVGLMAGTSLDGLDVAVCAVSAADYATGVELKHFSTAAHPRQLIKRIRRVAFREEINQAELTILHRDLGRWYGEQVNRLLDEWGIDREKVDLIASHGQTVYHVPSHSSEAAATFQCGDGDQIAMKTGITTISDFRQKFIAVGGEGAPITPHVDRLLFASETEHRLLLNIGGIANYTLLEKQKEKGGHASLSYSDTGPGNTLINQAVQYFYSDRKYDDNGEIAQSGNVRESLLRQLMRHPFVEKKSPKSTGPEDFSLEWVWRQMESVEGKIDKRDLIATLTQFTVETIACGLESLNIPDTSDTTLYVSGGGWHNSTLIRWLGKRMEDWPIRSFSKLGIDPDAREAVSFGVLGNQTICGQGVAAGMQPSDPYIRPGKISLAE